MHNILQNLRIRSVEQAWRKQAQERKMVRHNSTRTVMTPCHHARCVNMLQHRRLASWRNAPGCDRGSTSGGGRESDKIGVAPQEKRGGGEIASPSSSRRVLWLPELDGVGKDPDHFSFRCLQIQVVRSFADDTPSMHHLKHFLDLQTREPHHFM